MTKEEYLSKTKVKNVEEARSLLMHLRVLFAVVFASVIIAKAGFAWVSNEDTYGLAWLCYLVLLIFFIVYCAKVIRLTKGVTKANVLWSFLFAPISWIWFYPAITRPLRIITGEIEPPETINNEIDDSASKKSFWKILKVIGIVCGLMVAIAIIAGVVDESTKTSNTTISNATQTAKNNSNSLGYRFTSVEGGFEVDLPKYPTRQEKTESLDGNGTMTTVIYDASSNGIGYLIAYHTFSNPEVDEYNPDYNVKTGLEASLNEMVNGNSNTRIIKSDFVTYLGHQALQYRVLSETDYLDGIMFFNGKIYYQLIVEYDSKLVNNGIEDFKNGLKLTNVPQIQTSVAPTTYQPNYQDALSIVEQADYTEGYKAGYADGRSPTGKMLDSYSPPATEKRRNSYIKGYFDGFLKGCHEGSFDCTEVERLLEEDLGNGLPPSTGI